MKKQFLPKLLSLVLGTVMIVTTLVGCNSAPKDAGPSWVPDSYHQKANVKNDKAEILPGEIIAGSIFGEEYAEIVENPFISVAKQPLSTFSADVDTASYSNFRRMIRAGYTLDAIPADAIRTEEFLNYFRYDYAKPKDGEPFGVTTKIGNCPWNAETKLAVFGFRTEDIRYEDSDKPSNFVFLIDVSGSMADADKLPLLQEAFSALTEKLSDQDTVSIVTYSGKEKVVLRGCKGSKKDKILNAIRNLTAYGSTNGQAGLQKAYSLAQDYFIEGGNNRIIMASDGDLNVGISSAEELKKYVEDKRKSGIYLSVLGFGTGNYKDARMEALADNGNGNYFYIDCLDEARKVLGEELNATINTVADDVKFQVDFNPKYVSAYRLIGYENRMLNAEDFKNDTKDAGEVGSGHMLTVAYELQLTPLNDEAASSSAETEPGEAEWLTINVAYKNPGETKSLYLNYPVTAAALISEPDDDFCMASALIEVAMLLRACGFRNNEAEKANLTEESLRAMIAMTRASLDKLNPKGDKYKEEFKSLAETVLERAAEYRVHTEPKSKYQ